MVLAVVLAVVVVAWLSAPTTPSELTINPRGVITASAPGSTEPPADLAPTEPPVLLAAGDWLRMPDSGLIARTRHSATWTGAELLVWGGQPDPSAAAGARYDPEAQTWTPMAPSPIGSRVGHTATWTGTELVIVKGAPIGQVAAAAAQHIDGAAYDPVTDTWREIARTPIAARTGHTTVWTGEEVVVFGGSPTLQGYIPAGLYDPATDTWRLSSPSPLARGHGVAAAVWTGTEVVIWTGTGEEDVAAYDPVTDAWRLLPGSPATMRSISAVWTGEEVLLLGQPERGRPEVGGMALDVDQQRWTILPPSPLGMAATFAAVWTGSEAIVVGGSSVMPGAVWSPALGRWAPLPGGSQAAIGGHSATWTGEQLLVWGGQGANRPLASGLVFQPTG
ncbi:hypothetical protein BH23ACT9_BH23ACT9_33340 [soil metagenome]